VSHEKPKVNILNQWTYQARLYNAAYYVAKNKDMELIQLVSFGCGTDAITSDEVKDILERNNKIYTQLKIDETNNLGAAKIRIRSLLEAIAQE
ncbi:MAG: 2-hydroxyacyl-CoA dehydratase, partial [Clostridium perfringens]|nr:2-hydroxyacyl-CoA dehydratase [Clostridium perfringens]